ncbi:MAG: ABC transporter permease [Gemmatimonadota bacterium]
MTPFLIELRHATRAIGRRPGFTALAVLTLGLGIGATTAIFSVINPILLAPLPYPTGDRLAMIWEREKDGSQSLTSFATIADIGEQTRTLDRLAAIRQWQPNLAGDGAPDRITGQRVGYAFFDLLGVQPLLGRTFTAEEDNPTANRVVVLSYGLWRRRFGEDKAIIGKAISLDDTPWTVIGVLPRTFESLLNQQAEMWGPLRYGPALPYACRTCRHIRAVGRVKPGMTIAQATDELNRISAGLVRDHPTEYPASGFQVVPLKTQLTQTVRPALLVIFAAVSLVLLIACANVANLLLGLSFQRRHEFAIRSALGAGRWDIARTVLAESGIIAVLGAGLGVVIAWGALATVLGLAPTSLPRLDTIHLDPAALGFTALLAAVTGLGFGVGPAVWLTRAIGQEVRSGGRLTASRSRHLLRRTLVVSEVALAVVLLVATGLLIRSLTHLLAVDPGFTTDHLLTMEVQTAGKRYAEDGPTRQFFAGALESVEHVSGVRAAAFVSQLPLGGSQDGYGIRIQSKPLANDADAPGADRYTITPRYPSVMAIPLRSGRVFTAADREGASPVVLINETFARLNWPGQNPIGDRIQLGEKDTPWRTIVGVLGDIRHASLDKPSLRQIYIPQPQWQFADGSMILVARTSGDPDALTNPIREAIWSIDRNQPILGVASMAEVIRQSTSDRRFVLMLFRAFAVLALVLASAGLYGVVSSSVTERTRELGIRAALGASRRRVLRLVVGEGFALTGLGISIGLVGALAATRLLQSALFGISSTDPVTYAAVAVIVVAMALVSSWWPAWRAARVEPTVALRQE